MAEAAAAVPSFKLVLVGDGGTGKVRNTISSLEKVCDHARDQQNAFLQHQYPSSD
jgi:hypothetical protein